MFCYDQIMKDLMFKIVCEAMQLRADDDIEVLDDKVLLQSFKSTIK